MSPQDNHGYSRESCLYHESTHSSLQDSQEKWHLQEDEDVETGGKIESSSNPIAEEYTSTVSSEKGENSAHSTKNNLSGTAVETAGVELERRRGRLGYSEAHRQCDRGVAATKADKTRQESFSTSILTGSQPVVECSKNVCCANYVAACNSDAETHPTPPASHFFEATESASMAVTLKPENIDIERNLFRTQRITLQVQGMTCTSCEKKLLKSLTSLPEISQVKTSLLLAQAEFHLRPSRTLDAGNIASTLQNISGFACTKIVHVREELELIVESNAQEYADHYHWPSLVVDLIILSKNRIRVSYDPKAIGARKLLSDTFFQHTRLAPPGPSPLIASGRAHLWKSFYMTLLSFAYTIPVLVLAWGQLPRHDILYGAISLVLATIVQVVVAKPFYFSAAKSLFQSRMIDMDLLIVLSTTTAYVYSIVAYACLTVGRPLVTGEFFETSTLLVTFIMVGRTLSSLARQKAVESINIESLQPNTAIIIDHEDGAEKVIDARLLQYNDFFKVLPDTSIVTDGIVITGESEVDESLITGEASLVHKRSGNSVIAGSINHYGTLKVQVTRLPWENTINTIREMVNEVRCSKPEAQELADRVLSYFVPAILGFTLVVLVAWIIVGEAFRHQSAATSCITAMTYAISVLIVSCPCAIGLAVPMVVIIAGGVGAQNGLIFKTAETIDTARKVSHVIFDKTGTLTQGKLYVVEEWFIKAPSKYEPSVILGLIKNSKHPVAKAVASHLVTQGIEPSVIDHIVSVPGKGIQATCKGYAVKAGNPYWLNVQEVPQVRRILASGLSLFCVTVEDILVAVYGLEDRLRPDAITTITELQKREIEISIVSGDTEESVHSLAADLGIPSSNVLARCTPEEKETYVKSKLLISPRSKKKSIVLFCGDGTNDAPSLVQASIGVHMNEGTEIAASAADAVIMYPSIGGILTLMDLSKAFHRRVVFNFVWSFMYNIFAVLLAAGTFPHTKIPPQYAGLGEVVSILPVIAIAMGLKCKRF